MEANCGFPYPTFGLWDPSKIAQGKILRLSGPAAPLGMVWIPSYEVFSVGLSIPPSGKVAPGPSRVLNTAYTSGYKNCALVCSDLAIRSLNIATWLACGHNWDASPCL